MRKKITNVFIAVLLLLSKYYVPDNVIGTRVPDTSITWHTLWRSQHSIRKLRYISKYTKTEYMHTRCREHKSPQVKKRVNVPVPENSGGQE